MGFTMVVFRSAHGAPQLHCFSNEDEARHENDESSSGLKLETIPNKARDPSLHRKLVGANSRTDGRTDGVPHYLRYLYL